MTNPTPEPSAFVMVPREPTEAMLEAGKDAAWEGLGKGALECERRCYRAMIAAAPTPPTSTEPLVMVPRSVLEPFVREYYRFLHANPEGEISLPQALPSDYRDLAQALAAALLPAGGGEQDFSDEPSLRVLTEIGAERERQKAVGGWTAEHDDQHSDRALSKAAACYALNTRAVQFQTRGGILGGRAAEEWTYAWKPAWPWDLAWWKPRSPRENLIRAGALIVAEIERIDRAQTSQNGRKDGSSPQTNDALESKTNG